MLGEIEGEYDNGDSLDGDKDGLIEADRDGDKDGLTDADLEGDIDADLDGDSEALTDGDADGDTDILRDGLIETLMLGEVDGDTLGEKLASGITVPSFQLWFGLYKGSHLVTPYSQP